MSVHSSSSPSTTTSLSPPPTTLPVASLGTKNVVVLDNEKLHSKANLYIVIACVVSFIAVSFLTGGIAGALLAAGTLTIAGAYAIFLSGMSLALMVTSYFSVKHGAIETARAFIEKHPTIPEGKNYLKKDGTINETAYFDDLQKWFTGVKYMQKVESQDRDYLGNIDEYLTNGDIDQSKMQTAKTDLARGATTLIRINKKQVSLGINPKELTHDFVGTSVKAFDNVKKELIKALGNHANLADEILACVHIGCFAPIMEDFNNAYASEKLVMCASKNDRREIMIDIKGDTIRISTVTKMLITSTVTGKTKEVSRCLLQADMVLSKRADDTWDKTYSTNLTIV